MFINFFKIAVRSLLKQKIYSLINIVGFSIGLAACFLVFSYAEYELSYDSFHKDNNRVFRVVMEGHSRKGVSKFAVTSFPLATALIDNFPQVENSARIRYSNDLIVRKDDIKYFENKFLFTDTEIFNILTFPFIKGDPDKSLDDVNSVVITEKMARKYFRDDDPLGEILNIDNLDRIVTGIVQNAPHNSHIQYDFFLPVHPFRGRHLNQWGRLNYHTYLKLKDDIDLNQFKNSIKHIANKYIGNDLDKYGETRDYYLQPIKDIYLHSNLDYEEIPPGKYSNILIFSFTAILFEGSST